MQKISIDAYVIDVSMPDLMGHDERPSAFVVDLFLLRHATRSRHGVVAVSLPAIVTRTGSSKSSVLNAWRRPKRRGLLDPERVATTADPRRRPLRPWVR